VVHSDALALADILLQLLGDRGARTHLGELARQTWQAQSGATQRTADALAVLMGLRPSSPVGQPSPAPKLAEGS